MKSKTKTKKTTGFLYKRGDVYWARWQHEGKSYRQTTKATNLRDAQAKLREFIEPYTLKETSATITALQSKIDATETALAKIEDRRNPPPKLAELWQVFRDSPGRPDIAIGTMKQYECQIERFAAWAAENHPEAETIRDITPEVAENFFDGLIKGKTSPNTFNKYLALLRQVWRVLRDSAKIEMDPWQNIARRKLATVSRRELTVEELKMVCRAAQGELQVLFAIGIFTGLRLGDAATLKWSEVDLERGIILRVPNKTARSNPQPVTVPLVPELRAMLSNVRTSKSSIYVMPETARRAREDYDALIHSIQNLFRKCGIETRGELSGTRKRAPVVVGFHSLRHSFVSICRMAGVPLVVVESIVGHSNPSMTRHYSHVGIEASVRAVSTLPNVMTDPPALPPPAPASDVTAAAATLAKVRQRVSELTARNWKKLQTEILAMIPA
jgi:integrase